MRMRTLLKATLIVAAVTPVRASAFVGQTTGPWYETACPSHCFYANGDFALNIALSNTGDALMTTGSPGMISSAVVPTSVSISGFVSLTTNNSLPPSYASSGVVDARLMWIGPSSVEYGPTHQIVTNSSAPHSPVMFTDVIQWNPYYNPVFLQIQGHTSGTYAYVDNTDTWSMSWEGDCEPGYVSTGTDCVAGVLFGGNDVFSHSTGADLTMFQTVDSGGALDPNNSLATEPCLTPNTSECTSPAIALGDCYTSATRIPLEHAATMSDPCPSGQASCSCGAGDLESGAANCRLLLGQSFSGGGPSPVQPVWADAPLSLLKITTSDNDYYTKADVSSHTGGVCSFNTNEPRNELQDPVDGSGSPIQPALGDNRYYVWFTYVPSPTATDPFKNLPTCSGGSCNAESPLIFQFHQNDGDACGGGSPPLGFGIGRGGGFPTNNDWYWSLGSVPYPGAAAITLSGNQLMTASTWHTFILNVKWSDTCNGGSWCATPPVNPDGSVQLWIDGTSVAGPTPTATMWDWASCGGSHGAVPMYEKTGFYGDSRLTYPATIYMAGYAITTSLTAAQAVVNGFTP